MTAAVRKIVDSIEALSALERHQATVEILRRAQMNDCGDLPDECLMESADELFQQMDADEARDAER